MVKPASAHGKVQHTARVLQSAVLWTCTCAAWHLCSRPRQAPAAAHCPPLPRGRSPLTAPCLLTTRPPSSVRARVCVAFASSSSVGACVWPLLPSRVVLVHAPCALPSAPVESTARGRHHRRALRVVHARACARAMATGGVSRRQAAVSSCRGIGRLSVCRARARTVLAESGADHFVGQHRGRCLAHHRLDGLSHCDPCSRIHTGCGRVHTGCDRK